MFFIVGGSRSPLTEDLVVLLLSRSHSKKPLRPLQSPLMIELVGVYLVTGTTYPDISQEGTLPQLSGTLKDGQTRFLRLFHWTHIGSQEAVWPVVQKFPR
jgi:hypothetical protein